MEHSLKGTCMLTTIFICNMLSMDGNHNFLFVENLDKYVKCAYQPQLIYENNISTHSTNFPITVQNEL